MSDCIRIATRASKLALWQANFVRDRLLELQPDRAVELVEIISTGDAVRDRPLYEVGGVGLFTKEIQDAVLNGSADVAVHSMKDLPTATHPELTLAAVPRRGPVDDALLSPRYRTLDSLPQGATVATSSLRRRAQLLRRRPDLNLVDIRGNVETRIRKLHEQELDGLVLAVAGIVRLGLESEITEQLGPDRMIPAVGQGALAIECRGDDAATRQLLARLEDQATRQAVEAERAFLHALQGGCQLPIGGFARVAEDVVHLQGIVLSRDGARWFEGSHEGSASSPKDVGLALAEQLIAQGAQELLRG